MSIIRRKRNRDYTVLNNEIFECGLSADSVAILAYLLSRPDDWEVNALQLKSVFNFGRNKVYKVLKELEESGFISRKQKRNMHSKRWGETDYVVYDEPQDTTDCVPRPQNRDTEKSDQKESELFENSDQSRVPESGPHPQSRVPVPVCPNRAHILSTDITNTEITNDDKSSSSDARDLSLDHSNFSKTTSKPDLDHLETVLRKTAGLGNSPAPMLADLSPIIRLIDAGYLLDRHILPVVADIAARREVSRIGSWKYFATAIENNLSSGTEPKPPSTQKTGNRHMRMMQAIADFDTERDGLNVQN